MQKQRCEGSHSAPPTLPHTHSFLHPRCLLKFINENRDFYADISSVRVPAHHVLVTNPPYSGDHKHRLVEYLFNTYRQSIVRGRTPTPFYLLLPGWVATKAYWRQFLWALKQVHKGNTRVNMEFALQVTRGLDAELEEEAGVFYYVPAERYVFQQPEGQGRENSPFWGVWVCGGFPDKKKREAVIAVLQSHIEQAELRKKKENAEAGASAGADADATAVVEGEGKSKEAAKDRKEERQAGKKEEEEKVEEQEKQDEEGEEEKGVEKGAAEKMDVDDDKAAAAEDGEAKKKKKKKKNKNQKRRAAEEQAAANAAAEAAAQAQWEAEEQARLTAKSTRKAQAHDEFWTPNIQKDTIARTLKNLQEIGLVPTPEEVRQRYEENPERKRKRDIALAELDEMRKKLPRKRNYAARDKKAITYEKEHGKTLMGKKAECVRENPKACKHYFFSETGCQRPDKCKFSHNLGEILGGGGGGVGEGKE